MNESLDRFRIGITHDFLSADGSLALGDIGLDLLKNDPRVEHEFLPHVGGELPRELADAFDALLVLAPRISASTLDGCERLTLVARFGVGYDSVDVPACTKNHVLLSITPDGVRRPVAVSALALLLALSHKLLIKDRITRQGRWHEKLDYMGIGLTGRTLGLVGLGNIGREIFKLAAPLDMRHVAFDPYASRQEADLQGIELVEFEELLSRSDFVMICCALTAETRHMFDARRLAMMRPSSFLINVARGPIVDQAALTAALKSKQLAGAALDVFEKEPIAADDPLLVLDNVVLAPHAICWTDEMFRCTGLDACQSLLDVAAGRKPKFIVNPDVLEEPKMKEKLARYANAVGLKSTTS